MGCYRTLGGCGGCGDYGGLRGDYESCGTLGGCGNGRGLRGVVGAVRSLMAMLALGVWWQIGGLSRGGKGPRGAGGGA